MPTLHELKTKARAKGIIGFSRMNKAELEKRLSQPAPQTTSLPVLQTTIKSILPQKVSTFVESSLDSINAWFGKMKKRVDLNLKENARKKLQKLNAKIGEMLSKPEFEIQKKPGLGGSTFTIEGKPGYSAEGFLKNLKPKLLEIFQSHPGFKIQITLVCKMVSSNISQGTEISDIAFFSSLAEEVFEGTDLERLIQSMIDRLLEHMMNFQRGRSNWRFQEVIRVEIRTDEVRVGKYIPLPAFLAGKKAIINMRNENDEECFKWCIGRSQNPVTKNAERITYLLRRQCTEFDWSNISFPVSWKDIDRFERNNDISVNVLGLVGKDIVTLRKTKEKKDRHVILFKLQTSKTSHFALVKNLNRLWFGIDSKHRSQRHVCDDCLNSFASEKSFQQHQEFCVHDGVRAVLPPEKSTMGFRKIEAATAVDFVIYADFESILKPVSFFIGEKTKQIQHHIPCSFCFLPVSRIGIPFSPVLFRGNEGDDVGKIFLEKLMKSVKDILQEIRRPLLNKNWKRIVWKKGDQEHFQAAKVCWLCEKKLDENDKVADHCHLTGRFRGAAHNVCNLQAQVPNFTPVFIHNLDGYDSHLFIKTLGKEFGEISAIPNNEEKYVSFSLKFVWDKYTNEKGEEKDLKHEIRFVDSLKFMNSSLANLVKNLGKNELTNLKRFFPDDVELLSRKGVYPYEYMTNFEKFQETQLPPQDAFFSKLNGEGISNEDFLHAQNVWRKFSANLGDYHDLYLKTDVLLLADVIENFRQVLLENYHLDPAWFLTAPSFFWAAMLKMTQVELELICEGNMEMFRFFERQIRGGVASVFRRFSQANNKFQEDFDPTKPSKFIVYLDANSLYPTAMMQALPTGKFEWMSNEALQNWERIVNSEDTGCTLEVDLIYPQHLHDYHDDFPLAPEVLETNGVQKLIPNLRDKHKMVLDGRSLQLFLSLGMKLKKLHRGISFRKEAFMKPFIIHNTKLRTAAKNDFEKELFKLASNAVYGKTMENVRNRIDMKLVNDREKKANLVKKINFKHATHFGEKLAAVHMRKTHVILNKPIFCGAAILDLSKIHMFQFHYNYVKKKWQNVKVLYSDTDSLILEIETDDFFQDTAPDVEEWFDTSGIPKTHFAVKDGFPTGKNKKVLGKFKDEAGGKIIREFVGLRPKCYSVQIQQDRGIKKAKGTKKNVTKSLRHQDFKDVLFGKNFPPLENVSLRSHFHEIFTETIRKVALSAEDDKRVVQKDGITTLALGNWQLS